MASRRAIGHWLILLLLSVLFSSLLLRIHLPAALLLGPLIAGLILSLRGVKLSIPRPCYLAAQAIVGCMIARAINPSVFGVLFNNWALVLAILLTTLAISGLTGWLLVRYSALPGATGAWGSSPGGASAMVVMAQEYGADVRLVALMQYLRVLFVVGASAMVVMAQEYGADVRLVALMQYLRVLFVVGAAALVVRYALGNEAQEMTQDIVWFPSLTLNFPFTLLLTAVACWLGMRLRIPSGAMLLPMLLGALAQGGGWLMLELPEWLLAMAYAVLGWTVGLQFNKAIFLLALKTLPQIIASILGLILMCALMALALTHILQMDFMTAYLATSPGGLDTVAIIAAGTRADMSFIMALQTLRLFTILLTGPAMARAISRYAPRQ
ncbi:TPA: AbrB family transcriptional regulator [Klebsiella pneumoniae]|nr:AbrB family transcriptional regulator [Klebsiella pneumoniae]HBZ9504704.1 AbrB family transcriptional regulator [Klebsiella pneumoniae]HCA0074941.1 AbrB family transcriptional regulator [Klebsiella pneumoniae]HCA1674111.1 AbrB family transcriptional regulator [Klebsiella pneumoniae]